MADNPAVRAVAAEKARHFYKPPVGTQIVVDPVCLCGWYPEWGAGLLEQWRVHETSSVLAALASSQEVRQWLARRLQRETQPPTCDPETPPDDEDKAVHWVRCQVVVAVVLNALGGGE